MKRPKDPDFQELVYLIFSPEIRHINQERLLRDAAQSISHYHHGIDALVVAASLYGTAKRIGLEIVTIESESPEEFAIRRKLRGKTDQTVISEIANMPIEEVYDELERHGISMSA